MIALLEQGGAARGTGASAGAPDLATTGVVLLADISGYSPLTEGLARKKGTAGIDQLARVLEDHFGRIVERVEAWGGEVVTFAGDAVIAWWEARGDAEMAEGVDRAVACSLGIEEGLGEAVEGVTVRMRQVVAAGELRALRLGEAPANAILSGAALEQLAQVSTHAPVGRTTLTDAAAARWQRAGRTLPLPQGHLVLPGPPVSPPPLPPPPAVPAEILAKYRAPHAPRGGHAELRVITALFVRLLDDDGDAARLHRAVCAAQAAIARHLGALHSVCHDDKGLVVVAAFGLPAPDVYRPSDPARAALAIRSALAALGVGSSCGLATGPAFFGESRLPDDAAGARRTIALVGSPLNLAARLMMFGTEAWCDHVTARAARGEVGLSAAQVLRLKGFPAAIHARRLLDATADAAEVLVGRADATAALDAAVDALRAGRGGIVRVEGEPGIGKSAVVRQATRRARSLDVHVVELTGIATETQVPFRAWAAVAPSALDLAWPPDAAPPAAGGDALGGFVRAARAVELLGEMLAPLPGEAPRLFVAEDAHALDSRSLEVLEALAERGALVILAARSAAAGTRDGPAALTRVSAQETTAAARCLRAPSPPDSLPGLPGKGAGAGAGAGGNATTTRVELGRLPIDDVAALVRSRLGAAELPEGLLAWLWARGGGHPQFTIELLAVAQEEGFLELDRAGAGRAGRVLYFDRAGLEATAPPDTVQSAIATRLDRLPAAAIALLKAASAVGRRVDRAALAATGLEGIDASLEPLVDAGWLVVGEDEGLSFASATVRDAVHGLLVRDQRRRLHGALAAHVGALPDAADPSRIAILADHLAHAGVFDRAIEALDRAYGHALSGGLGRSAVGLATRALALDDEARDEAAAVLDPRGRAAWHHRVAVACRLYGDTDLALTHLHAAAEALELPLPADTAGWRRRLLVEALRHVLEAALPFARRGDPRDALRAAVLNLLSLAIYLRSKQPEALLASAVQAVRLSWRSPTAHTALATSMVALAASGLGGLPDRYLAAGEARALALGDPREQLDAALGRLMVDLANARWSDAEPLLVRVLPWIRASRADALHAVFLGLFGCIDLLTGRVDRCAERAAEMIGVAEREGYLQARGWARNLQASLALLADDLDTARRYCDEAQTILDRRAEPDRLAPRALRAQAALRAGDLPTALAEVATLEGLIAAESLVSVTGLETYATAPEVHLYALLAQPKNRAHLAAADAALRPLRAFVRRFPVGAPRLSTLMALRRFATGRDATAVLAEAQALATARAMPLEQLRVLELRERIEGGDRGAGALRAELIGRLGATPPGQY